MHDDAAQNNLLHLNEKINHLKISGVDKRYEITNYRVVFTRKNDIFFCYLNFRQILDT
jgi:hypothetical protein